MQSGTQPGLGQHWRTAQGEAFSGIWGCFPGLRTGSDGGKVRPRCGPAHSGPSCQAKKNPPALPGDRFCDRGRRGSKELGAVDLQLEGEIQIFRRTFGEHHAGEEDLKVVHNGTDAGVDGEDQRNGAGAAVEDQ